LEEPKSGIVLEMSQTNSCCEHDVGGYTNDEESDFTGDSLAISPEAEDGGNLCLSHGNGAAGSCIQDAGHF